MRKRRKPTPSPGVVVLTLLFAAAVALGFIKHWRDRSTSAPTPESLTMEALPREAVVTSPRPEAISVRVIDGDTLALGTERIRLFGIDAPEKAQSCLRRDQETACGHEATRALEALISITMPACDPRSTDRYGRTVAACTASGRDFTETGL